MKLGELFKELGCVNLRDEEKIAASISAFLSAAKKHFKNSHFFCNEKNNKKLRCTTSTIFIIN